jgi:hypothetical protein
LRSIDQAIARRTGRHSPHAASSGSGETSLSQEYGRQI